MSGLSKLYKLSTYMGGSYERHNQLLKNLTAGTWSALAGILINIAAYPVYLHKLGYAQYGTWLLLSTMLTLAQMGHVGINPAVSKLIAEDLAHEVPTCIQRHIATAWALVIPTGLVIAIFATIWRASIVSMFRLPAPEAASVAALLPFVAVLSMYAVMVDTLGAALEGTGRLDLVRMVQSISQVLSTAVGIGLVSLGYGLAGLMTACLLLYLMQNAGFILLTRRIDSSPVFRLRNVDRQCLRRLTRMGGWLLAASTCNVSFSPINKLFVARYAGLAAVPVYELSWTTALRLRGVIESALRALLPETSRRIAENHKYSVTIYPLFVRATRVTAVAGGALYALCIATAGYILPLWLGDRYLPSVGSMTRWMLCASYISLLSVPAHYMLIGAGTTRYCFVSGAVMNVTAIAGFLGVVLMTKELTTFAVGMTVMASMSASTVYVFYSAVSRFKASVNLLPYAANGDPTLAHSS